MTASRSTRPRAGLMLDGLVSLCGASLVIRLFPFSLMMRSAIGTNRQSRAAPAGEAAAIRRVLRAWSRRLPWRTLCFEQGLAAQWMLRRRGLESTLHYGARTIDGKLKAHVWVRSGETDVIGCENAADYALLASFPPAVEGNSSQKW